VQEAHTLRRGEHEVESAHWREPLLLEPARARMRVDPLDRDRPLPRRTAKQITRAWIAPLAKRGKVPLLDDAVKAEPFGASARPHARRLAAAAVILVKPLRHRLLVVTLLPLGELRDT